MLAILANILAALEDFPALIISGVDQVINGLFAAIAAFVTELFALLPSMGTAPDINGGDWLGWLNWVYPIGEMLDILTGLITMYVIFLGVKYALQLVRAL